MGNEICSGALIVRSSVRLSVRIILNLWRWHDRNLQPRGLNSFPHDDIDICYNLQHLLIIYIVLICR